MNEQQTAYAKLEKLQLYIRDLGALAVAFSSGVDSTFLLKVAHDVLGEKAIAVTASADFFPQRESTEAAEFCQKEGIKQFVCPVNELEKETFCQNPPDRCYYCKKDLFTEIQNLAKAQGIEHVAEGSNMDDNNDYRPGMRAIKELEILSPLRYAELTKAEIRFLSKEMDLPTWDKPSYACLASRFVYGEPITKEKLSMVEKAEQLLYSMGFIQFRVRIHGMMARIEVLPEDFSKLTEEKIRSQIVKSFKEYGFTYVSMDLSGYRTGSMNETLF